MDYRPTPDEERLLAVGRELSERFGRAYWLDHLARREFPRELWRALGEAGHLGLLVPAEVGGRGRGLLDLALLAEGLAAAGLPQLAIVTGPGLALPAIGRAGTPELRRDILPDLLTGRALAAFAITEASAGTDLRELETRAEVRGEEVVLTGAKVLTSVADVADHIVVVALTPDAASGRPAPSVVVVPRDARGLVFEAAPTVVAATERQCDLRFEEVVLPRSQVLGAPGAGLAVLADAPLAERVLAASLAVGVGSYALGRAVERSRGRSHRGRPIGALQAVQNPLARAAARLEGARHLVRQAAAAADRREPGALGLSDLALAAAAEAGHGATDAALQAMGGLGYRPEGELAALLGFARLLRSAPVHAEAALAGAARHVLRLPRPG